MMPMGNNFLFQLLSMFQGGQDPTPLINQMSKANPNMGQAAQLIQGKHGDSLRNTCLNAYKERGINVEQMAHFFKLNLPK